MSWLRQVAAMRHDNEWRGRARASIIDVNDGIVSAAGVAEGFARAGAATSAVLFAGAVVIFAGGLAAAGTRFTEEQTEWEMNRSLIEAERASIEADPAGELEELVGLYEAKGLDPDLARQVAEALTERDPVAAHADVELNLESLGRSSGGLAAGATAFLSFAAGALVPLVTMYWPLGGHRVEFTFVAVLVALALTGWLAAYLTGLPVPRMIVRNLLLGAVIMAIGQLVGLVVDY